MRILCLNGPNLNVLDRRDPDLYGGVSLERIEEALRRRAAELGAELQSYQSNHEGGLIDCIQEQTATAQGIIINPGALTHYGLSLRDALTDTALPVVEVHLSNIARREAWRARSVVASVAVGQVTGLGWRGYLYALDFLVAHINKEAGP
jgi:3-dehydroquinate dehydratase-2